MRVVGADTQTNEYLGFIHVQPFFWLTYDGAE